MITNDFRGIKNYTAHFIYNVQTKESTDFHSQNAKQTLRDWLNELYNLALYEREDCLQQPPLSDAELLKFFTCESCEFNEDMLNKDIGTALFLKDCVVKITFQPK